jgi:hypothetical protein
MLGKFWEGVGDKLAERWADVSVPALVFWLGGFLAWIYSHGGVTRLAASVHWLVRLPTSGQVALLLAALAGVAGSGVIVSRLTFPALQILEGYWPRFCSPLRRLIISRVVIPSAKRDEKRLEVLFPLVLETPDKATAEQFAALASTDVRRRRRPRREMDYMPTRTGNILRAAEEQPERKYGLNSVIVWPRLWLLLPDSVRQELATARTALDTSVSSVVWGLLFCLFAFWTPLALVAGLGVAVSAAAFWVPGRAETFGDLMEAAYDLYRVSLYEQLRWPLPKDAEDEASMGAMLTEYLWRGSSEQSLTFTSPAAGSPE